MDWIGHDMMGFIHLPVRIYICLDLSHLVTNGSFPNRLLPVQSSLFTPHLHSSIISFKLNLNHSIWLDTQVIPLELILDVGWVGIYSDSPTRLNVSIAELIIIHFYSNLHLNLQELFVAPFLFNFKYLDTRCVYR